MKFCTVLAPYLFPALLILSCSENPVATPPVEPVHPAAPFLPPRIAEVRIATDSTLAISWYDLNTYGSSTWVTYVIEQADEWSSYHMIGEVSAIAGMVNHWSVRAATDTARTYRFCMRTIKGIDTSARSSPVRSTYGPVLAIGGVFEEVVGMGSYLSRPALYNGWLVNGVWNPSGFNCGMTIYKAKVWTGSDFDGNVARGDTSGYVVEQTGAAGGIRAFAEYKGDLYAGARWVKNNSRGEYIVRRSEAGWSSVDAGLDGPVTSLTVFHDELYVGGNFQSAGGEVAWNIACWNGTRWKSTGAGLPTWVEALEVHSDQLYAATENSVNEDAVYTWNGVAWTRVGPGFFGSVTFLVSHAGRLYAGGSISLRENASRYGLIVLQDSTWLGVPASSGKVLTAAAEYRENLYLTEAGVNYEASLVVTTSLKTVFTVMTRPSGWTFGPHLTSLCVGSMWTWGM